MEKTPTKEECWNAFWGLIGPALVDLHREGKLPTEVPSIEQLIAEGELPADYLERRRDMQVA